MHGTSTSEEISCEPEKTLGFASILCDVESEYNELLYHREPALMQGAE
jgi:hypothetical protein